MSLTGSRRGYPVAVCILTCWLQLSCGGGSSSSGGAASVTSVSVSGVANVLVGTCAPFTAAVSGTGSYSHSVNWYVDEVAGGSADSGTIDSKGIYCAPQQPPAGNAVTIKAISTADSGKFGSMSAQVVTSAGIVISPANPQVLVGDTIQFHAQVTGSNDTDVHWLAVYGSINSSGLYSASGTQTPDTVTAWVAGANGTTSVQVLGLKPIITSISSPAATVFELVTIQGKNLVAPLSAVFSDAIGGSLTVIANANADGTSATATVPQGSVTGPLYVTSSQGGLSAQASNMVPFHRLAKLRIHAARNDVSAGESLTMQYALMGDSTPRPVSFTTDLGSFSGANYLAPANVFADAFAHITGCITGTNSCNKTIIGVHPFRVGPELPLVSIGDSLQLSALQGGGTTAAAWSLLSGGGSVSANGLYSAGSQLLDGGPALVSAVSSGKSETASVGVTGGSPGLLNRIQEYADEHGADFEGIYSYGMAVIGSRLYVVASNHIGSYANSYFWIDVYDISDPLNPAWLTAVESDTDGPLFVLGQDLYSFANVDLAVPGYPNTITLYSAQSGVPVLKARTTVPSWWSMDQNQGVLSLVTGGVSTSGKFDLWLYDLRGGTISSNHFALPLPSDANGVTPDATLPVGNRLFVSTETNDLNLGGRIAVYDLATSPPALLGTVSGRSLRFYSSGNLLFGALGGMDTYDISSTLPQHLSHVEGINAQALHGTELLAFTGQQGCRMVDVSDPQNPKVTATLFDGVITGCDYGAFVGNYIYTSEYVGGIAVYDGSKAGGPIPKTRLFSGGGVFWSDVYNQLLKPPYLYSAASTALGATLNVYDTSTVPPTRVGEYFDPTQQGFAVESAGHYLYFGMTGNTAVLDISVPSSPLLAAVLPLPATSFSRVGNFLFAGTGHSTFAVYNVTNPVVPALIKTISLAGLPLKLKTFGNLLFIADSTGGIYIYDVTAPASPALLTHVTTFSIVNDIEVVGTTAFVAADSDGLAIFNIANPASPALVSQTALSRIDPFTIDNAPNQAASLAVSNGVVYVGTYHDNGIVFGLDCRNLSHPRIVSAYANGNFILTSVNSLVFDGTDLYVGGSLGDTYSVTQMDMSQPFNQINQKFPPTALQRIAATSNARQSVGKAKMGNSVESRRFRQAVPAK